MPVLHKLIRMGKNSKEMRKCDPQSGKKHSTDIVSEGAQLLDLANKDFKAAIVQRTKRNQV